MLKKKQQTNMFSLFIRPYLFHDDDISTEPLSFKVLHLECDIN